MIAPRSWLPYAVKQSIVAAAFLFAAASLFAGVTYDFHSETVGLQQTTLDGSIAADGPNLRMTVTTGDGFLFKDGATVLSRDGGKTVAVFDPSSKTYFEIPFQTMTSSLGNVLKSTGVKLTFDNPTLTVKEAGDGGAVEGFPTKKTLIDASINMNVDAMGQTMTSKVAMHSESWTTDKLDPASTALFQQGSVVTGIEGLDKLVAAQSASVKGRFPLKQVTTVHIVQNGQDITSTTTATVSNVKQKALDAAVFTAPEGYTKVDNPLAKLGR